MEKVNKFDGLVNIIPVIWAQRVWLEVYTAEINLP